MADWESRPAVCFGGIEAEPEDTVDVCETVVVVVGLIDVIGEAVVSEDDVNDSDIVDVVNTTDAVVAARTTDVTCDRGVATEDTRDVVAARMGDAEVVASTVTPAVVVTIATDAVVCSSTTGTICKTSNATAVEDKGEDFVYGWDC